MRHDDSGGSHGQGVTRCGQGRLRQRPAAPEAVTRESAAGAPTELVLVVGISGSGKTTVGLLLAERLGRPYRDADEFHSEANRAKMEAGHALTDTDREPWLDAIGAWMDREIAARRPAVIGCSALKRAYRDQLLAGRPGVRLVYLHGSRELIRSRLAARRGHFFPSGLLDSQFADLQEPEPDEHPLVVEIDQPPEAVARCRAVVDAQGARRGQSAGRRSHGPRRTAGGATNVPPARQASNGSCGSAGSGPSWSSWAQPCVTTRRTADRCWTGSPPTPPSPVGGGNFSSRGPTGSTVAVTASTAAICNSR